MAWGRGALYPQALPRLVMLLHMHVPSSPSAHQVAPAIGVAVPIRLFACSRPSKVQVSARTQMQAWVPQAGAERQHVLIRQLDAVFDAARARKGSIQALTDTAWQQLHMHAAFTHRASAMAYSLGVLASV